MLFRSPQKERLLWRTTLHAPQNTRGPHLQSVGRGPSRPFLWRTVAGAPQKFIFLWRMEKDAPQKVEFLWRTSHGAPQNSYFLWRIRARAPQNVDAQIYKKVVDHLSPCDPFFFLPSYPSSSSLPCHFDHPILHYLLLNLPQFDI